MKSNYIERVNGFIVPYLAKNGYELIKTEFVTEDNNNFLRLYIDLTKTELAKRKAKQEAEAGNAEAASADNAEKASAETGTVSAAANEVRQSEPSGIITGGAGISSDAADTSAADTNEETITPGVSINDCVKVSRYLSKWLDKEDFIKEMYTMEVCSKGFLEDAATSEEKETV